MGAADARLEEETGSREKARREAGCKRTDEATVDSQETGEEVKEEDGDADDGKGERERRAGR